MSGDSLVWFLAGIGVGLAVAMLAFLLMSIADRRAITRQRRQSESRRVEALPPQPVPQAIRLADIDARTVDREADRRATPRMAPRERGRKVEPQLGPSAHLEPDFGMFAEPPRLDERAAREPDLVFDLTDLPEVTTPTSVDAYVPSFEPPAPVVPPVVGQPVAEVEETSSAAPEAPAAAVPAPEQQPAPERPAIRRPAPPPRPLPAAARAKSQAQAVAPAPAPPTPPARPAPISIAPLKSAAARTSGDGSKAPANFRPLLPKTDGAARPARPVQRRPFTEITVPFEGPAVLPDTAADRPVADTPPVDGANSTAPTAQPQAPVPVPEVEATKPVVETVAAEPLGGAPAAPAPQPTAPEPAKAPAPIPAAGEVELDTAAAAAIEKGSGGPAASARPSKALPKMPPPRLTPDTVEAIFAEAFARGSAEPPERKT